MWKRVRVAVIVALAAAVAAPAVSAERVVTVSPGEAGRASVEGRCPTFSWSAVPGAESYELVVYEFSEEPLLVGGGPALSRVLPGGALSWTPGRGDCLAAGTKYAWFVRAVGPGLDGGWSAERLFATEAGVNERDATEALAVLQEYLADGGDLADLVASTPAAAKAAMMPGRNRSLGAARLETSQLSQKSEEEGAADWRAPVALAPVPLEKVGLRAFVDTVNLVGDGGDAIAVHGRYRCTNNPTPCTDDVVGYLGVAASTTTAGEFDSYPQLKGVNEDEMGVLGFSANSSGDNYGVVGVGTEASTGGRFFNASAAGAVSNEVLLGGPLYALFAQGPTYLQSLTVSTCPSGTHEVGAFCIGPEETARNWWQARENCEIQRKFLCPLEAIMACDTGAAPAGADCKTATDLGIEKWIWCLELDDATNNDNNVFSDPNGLARVFAQTGNHSANEADWHQRSNSYVSYCCTYRP